MDEVIEYADCKNLGLIVCMDSNCHSTLFGPETNARGRKLEEAIASYNLIVENVGHVPTFHRGKARTCIDITLTKRLHSAILGWTVNTNYNGSDHNTIEFSVEQDCISIPKTWVWKRADWELFRTHLTGLKVNLPEVVTNDTREELLGRFYKQLNMAMQKSIPKSKTRVIDRNNPWWTEEFRSDRRNLNKLYKRMIKSPTLHNTNIYKSRHGEYKKKCNKARLWSWRDLQQDIGSTSDMNMLRKIVHCSSKVILGTLNKANGEYTVPGEDTIDYLSRIHFTKATPLRVTSKRGRTIRKQQVGRDISFFY